MFNLSPSVEYQEVDLTQFIAGTSTSSGGLVAELAWGPINEVTLVTSEEDLVSKFGRPNNVNYKDWFTAANFLSYSTNLKLVRLGSTTDAANARMYGSLASDPGTGVTQIDNSGTFLATAGLPAAYGVPFIARYAGAFGNDLKVSYVQSQEYDTWAYKQAFSQKPTGYEMAIVVLLNDTIVETFMVSTKSGQVDGFGQNNYMDDIINNTSQYIYSFRDNLFSVDFQMDSVAVAGTPVNAPGVILTGLNALTAPAPDTALPLVINTDTIIIPTTATALTIGTNVVGSKLEVTTGVNAGEVYVVTAIAGDGTTDVTLTLDRAAVATQTLNVNSAGVFNTTEENKFTATTSATDSIGELITFADGLDGTGTVAADYIAGWAFLDSAATVDISLAMEGGGDSAKLVANHIIQNVCEIRRDCVAFISPIESDVVASATPTTSLSTTRDMLPSTTYAMMDGNYKYQYDRYNDKFRWVPFNGDLAGLAARTDQTNGPWFSPAGYNRGLIKNVTKVAWANSSKAQRDDLYQAQINPVIQEFGSGTLLLGDKTLQAKDSAFSYINVRRLFIVLEKSIANAAKFSLFEFNDTITRNRFVQLVTPFLRNVQGQRGITDFQIIADETVNTPEVVNAAEFRATIMVKPNRSINFINLTFTAVPEGVSFDEVVNNLI